MKKIKAAGSSKTLGETMQNLSQAIEGVTSIKQQYAGNERYLLKIFQL